MRKKLMAELNKLRIEAKAAGDNNMVIIFSVIIGGCRKGR